MPVPTSSAIVKYGPWNGTTWTKPVSVSVRPVINDTSVWPVYSCPAISANTPAGQTLAALASDNVMATLGSIKVTSSAAINATLTGFALSFDVYRAGLQLGSARIAGWSTTAQNTAFVAQTPLAIPFYITNTTALRATPSAALSTTAALAELKPGDVVVMTVVHPNSAVPNLLVELDIN